MLGIILQLIHFLNNSFLYDIKYKNLKIKRLKYYYKKQTNQILLKRKSERNGANSKIKNIISKRYDI